MEAQTLKGGRDVSRKVFASVLVAVLLFAAGSASAWPATEKTLAGEFFDLGGMVSTMWNIPPGEALGNSSPIPAASLCGLYSNEGLTVTGEFGTAADGGNQIAGLWFGYLYRNWILLQAGIDSRYVFKSTGIGPSGSLSFIVPLSEGSAGRLEARYSNFPENGAAVRLGFGFLSDF